MDNKIYAKAFRFSGYFIDANINPYNSVVAFERALKNTITTGTNVGAFQQLHIEQSGIFPLQGELDSNCDLALLTRHFKKEIPMKYDRPLPKVGEVYKHFKIGKEVTIIGIARHTETEEINVVYKYEDTIWCRPLDMFMSEVDREKYPDAEQKYRFEKVDNFN